MGKVRLPPTPADQVGTHVARTANMERRLPTAGSPSVFSHPPGFSYPGQLVDGIESGPYQQDDFIHLSAARVSLLAAASTDLVIQVRINGTTVDTLTLPGTLRTIVLPVAITLGPDDYLTIFTETVPDDAYEMVLLFTWTLL